MYAFSLQFHEIVPDMDDEFMFNEKQSIRDSARSLKKYGSTCCNHQIRNNETLVRHDVEKTDTLQGIALKYGCTVSNTSFLFFNYLLEIIIDFIKSYNYKIIIKNWRSFFFFFICILQLLEEGITLIVFG